MKSLLFIVTLSVLTITSFAQTDSDKIDFNKYGSPNVTASRLIGRWVINSNMSLRLNNGKQMINDTLEFVGDSSAKHIIPQQHFAYIKDKVIYLSGFFLYHNIKYPFLLVETDGNSRVLFFRDRKGKKYDDGESFILFVAVSNDKANDLLLTGGDFNNEPFRAWDRIE